MNYIKKTAVPVHSCVSRAGPTEWGSQWPICSRGRFQSPIDIKPDTLLYDPNLNPLTFASDKKVIVGH